MVAAALYVGSRVVGSLVRRLLEHPNTLVLRADGIPHTQENATRLQVAATRATRRALREPPAAVVASPDPRGGWQVHLSFADQRPPLKPYELTDLQMEWARQKQKEFGPAERVPPSSPEVQARQHDASTAYRSMREAQREFLKVPNIENRERLDAALNQVQVSHDALRAALQAANPVRYDRPLHHDSLVFKVRLRGDEGLTLVDRDRAIGTLLARAAALPDARELRVTVRPTKEPGIWHTHVAFNFRNSAERGVPHLNPESLQETLLTQATSVPALAVKAGAAVARVGVAAIECVRPPARAAAERGLSLAPPAPMRPPETPERARA